MPPDTPTGKVEATVYSNVQFDSPDTVGDVAPPDIPTVKVEAMVLPYIQFDSPDTVGDMAPPHTPTVKVEVTVLPNIQFDSPDTVGDMAPPDTPTVSVETTVLPYIQQVSSCEVNSSVCLDIKDCHNEWITSTHDDGKLSHSSQVQYPIKTIWCMQYMFSVLA